MADLARFKQYLENNDVSKVQQFLAECDRASTDEGLRRAVGFFGFPTVEIEGIRYILGRDLARLGYGYKDTGSLQQFLKKYGRKLLSLAGFDDHHRSLIRQAFSLSPGDLNLTLATWGDLLLVGMKGETRAAQKVLAYLLETEQGTGGNGASEGLTGFSTYQLLRCTANPEDDPILRSSLRVMENVQNIVILRARQVEAEEALRRLQTESQGELPISPEQERTLMRMIDRLASYRSSPERPYGRVYLGVRSWLRARVGFSFLRGIIQKQFPLAQSLLEEAIHREEAAQEQQEPSRASRDLVREEKNEQ